MINPQWGLILMNKITIIIRILFAVTLFQQVEDYPTVLAKVGVKGNARK
jgi:hypothetical protein